MLTYFTIGKPRKIKQAGFVHYNIPVHHPARTFPEFHDLVYMEDGSWDITCGDDHYDVYKGDVFLLPAGIGHCSKHPCAPGTKTIYIHMFSVDGDNVGGDPPANDAIIRLPINTIVHCQNNSVIRSLFEEIWLLYSNDRPENEAMISTMLQTLLCMLYQCDNMKVSHGLDIVYKCIDIMKDEPNIIFKEADIAKRLFVSGKTLRSSFVRRFGKTFYQYQLDSKLGQVCVQLIEYPNMKLSEIASSFGFCDEFHLSKVFKKKYGISPAQYRKKTLGEGDVL